MKDTGRICELIKDKFIPEALTVLADKYQGMVVFSSSFSNEDQAITHIIFSNNIPIKIFTLDTGRMFAETYSVWSSVLEKYKKPIHTYSPKTEAIQELLNSKGPSSFYESVPNRKECCYIRKVEPLKRALKGNKVWITGIRSEHSASRRELPQVEWDEENNIIKYHPLLYWSAQEVNAFIANNRIPYNSLYDKGYGSIGCAPCTRAIKPGEDVRAGRWWWEDNDKKECGLHTFNS